MLGHGLDSMTSEFFPKLTDSVVLCSGLLRGRHVRDAILCGARRAAPVGGAVGRCGQGAGDPSLSPSTFYIPLRFLLSLLLPFALALRLGFSPCVPLLLLHLPSFPPAPRPRVALRSRRRDPNGLASRSSSLSPQSRMSSIQNLQSFDPFADATKGDDLLPAGTEDYIHIRIQQRNGRKTLTTVQGIADDYDKKKLVKAFKKKFACNGTVIEHPEYGEVIQLQGDQRKNICQFLLEIGIVKEEQLKVHGF